MSREHGSRRRRFSGVLPGAALLLLASCAPAVQSVTPPSAAQVTALFQQGDAAYRAGDYATSLRAYTQAAQAGNAEAQVRLGQMYQEGQGVPQDYAAARFWYEKAAAQGNPRGQLNLGLLYQQGLGVAQDGQQALKYFQAASDAGDIKGPRYVGLYDQTTGDAAGAFTAFQLGASRGDITSQALLGKAYELGQGVAQNYGLAAQWYTKAGERGDIIASDGLVGLASLYERGLGVTLDLQKATALYRQAASVGNTTAQAALQRLGVAAK